MTPKPVERLEKTLARVAREQGLDRESRFTPQSALSPLFFGEIRFGSWLR